MSRKHALCIGINDYPGTGSDLSGCVTDAEDWAAALDKLGFDIAELHDGQATERAIRAGMERIISDAKQGDRVVITFSGHGTWVPDEDDDERDARDEAICPHDCFEGHLLLDDEIYDIFAEKERGVRIIFISDSCHSGTVSKFMPMGPDPVLVRPRFLPPENILKTEEARKAARRIASRPLGGRKRHVGLLMSGCQDPEYSYDASFGGKANGAFTYYALKTLESLPRDATFRRWYRTIREHLPSFAYPQTPNLFGSRRQKKWKVFE